MSASTMTSKGQTTIPKDVRDAAGLQPGDRMHFTVLDDGTIILRVKKRSLRGLAIRPPGDRHVAVEEMKR